MNEFFVTVTGSLIINENFNDENATDGIADSVKKAVNNFSNHPSILKSKVTFKMLAVSRFKKLPLKPLTKSQAAFHVGRPEYVRRELGKIPWRTKECP